MFEPDDGLSPQQRQVYLLGKVIKHASDVSEPTPVYNLSGMLYVSERVGKPWGLLSVPNMLVRGVFDAMSEPGAELPLRDGKLEGHISVFRPDEIAMLGGPDALLNDRGKTFKYSIGRLETLTPANWAGVKKVFCLRIYSQELQQLRKSHGLSPLPNSGKFAFHVTVAIVRAGVLGCNSKSKETTAA